MWGRGAVVNLSRGAIKGTHLAHEQDQWRVESKCFGDCPAHRVHLEQVRIVERRRIRHEPLLLGTHLWGRGRRGEQHARSRTSRSSFVTHLRHSFRIREQQRAEPRARDGAGVLAREKEHDQLAGHLKREVVLAQSDAIRRTQTRSQAHSGALQSRAARSASCECDCEWQHGQGAEHTSASVNPRPSFPLLL